MAICTAAITVTLRSLTLQLDPLEASLVLEALQAYHELPGVEPPDKHDAREALIDMLEDKTNVNS